MNAAKENDLFIGEVEVNAVEFKETLIKFHLPKRFQDNFRNKVDLSFLRGDCVVVPEYDMTKRTKQDDEEKSSIPIMLFLKNKKVLRDNWFNKRGIPRF